MGIVKFDNPSGPNVVGNLLPIHSDKEVNAIIESGGKRIKMGVAKVKTPTKMGLEENEGHEIQECIEFQGPNTRSDK
ncbi:hypothetical protein GOBAR_DD06020 [Gossypium barbadense]|nr:hypothetical protein GOBAR_DD06020 [Gossypium barbadense]